MKTIKIFLILASASLIFWTACKSNNNHEEQSSVIEKKWDSLKNILNSFDADINQLIADTKKMNAEKMNCKPKKGNEKSCDSLKVACTTILGNLDSLYKNYKENVAKAETKAAELKAMLDKANKGDKEITKEKVQEEYNNACAELETHIAMYNPKSEDSVFASEKKSCEENCNSCEGMCESSEKTDPKTNKK